MERTKLISFLSISMILFLAQGLVMNADAAKKPKGIIIPEGDKAELVTEGSYNIINFPETLTAEDIELYNTDLVGYMLRVNCKMATDGSDFNGSSVYYYVHNSKEWLHKGQYESPALITVSRIKSIRISKSILRFRR